MLVTETVRPIDLPGLVRQILAETELTEPDDIAREVLKRIPVDVLRDVLDAVLPAYVRRRIAAERVVTTPGNAQRIMVRSSKVSGIHEWFRAALDDRVATSGGWKKLGDCTWHDLDYMVGTLRDQAERYRDKAERYKKLRDRLSQRDEERRYVRQLDKNAIQEFLGTFPDGTTSVPDEFDE